MELEGSQNPALEPILIQLNLVYTLPFYFSHSKITLTSSSHLRLDLRTGLFPRSFPTKIVRAYIPSAKRATCPANLILFDLVILKIL